VNLADLVARYLPCRLAPRDLPPLLADWPAEYRDAFEERVAIIQFDGGLSRAAAEGAAEQCVREALRRSHEEQLDDIPSVKKIIQ